MVEKRKYRDRAQYLIKAVAKRRRKIKQMAIEYKGGKCHVCGYNKYRELLNFIMSMEIKNLAAIFALANGNAYIMTILRTQDSEELLRVEQKILASIRIAGK